MTRQLYTKDADNYANNLSDTSGLYQQYTCGFDEDTKALGSYQHYTESTNDCTDANFDTERINELCNNYFDDETAQDQIKYKSVRTESSSRTLNTNPFKQNYNPVNSQSSKNQDKYSHLWEEFLKLQYEDSIQQSNDYNFPSTSLANRLVNNKVLRQMTGIIKTIYIL